MWVRRTFAYGSVFALASAGIVYLLDRSGHTLHALDAATGADRWTINDSALVQSRLGPACHIATASNGDAILGCARSLIRATISGTVQWEATLQDSVTDLSVTASQVLAVTRSGIEAQTLSGAPSWLQAGLAGPITSDAASNVYVATTNELVAISVAGVVQWRAPLGDLARAVATAANNTVAVTAFSGSTSGFDATTGTKLWTRNLPRPFYFIAGGSDLTATDGYILRVAGGYVWSLQPRTGAIVGRSPGNVDPALNADLAFPRFVSIGLAGNYLFALDDYDKIWSSRVSFGPR
jgi:outer membrane protein assembly factor BamB